MMKKLLAMTLLAFVLATTPGMAEDRKEDKLCQALLEQIDHYFRVGFRTILETSPEKGPTKPIEMFERKMGNVADFITIYQDALHCGKGPLGKRLRQSYSELTQ